MLFAGLWAGGTVFMAGAVLPAARRGHLSGDALEWVAKRFSYLSMASVAVLFATGGHLAGTLYTFERLGSTGSGHLVLTMVALWFVLAGLLHMGTRALTGTLETAGVDAAVSAARSWYLVSGVVAVALLVVAGML